MHQLNRDSYNAIATHWDAARATLSERERVHLEALVAGLSVPASILDLGCGTGRPIAAHLLGLGHRVTGVDQAEALLELARSRHPEANWIHAAIETFQPDARFDAIVCWDALFHMDRALHASLFRRFAEWLVPGGRLMLSFGGSAHPAFTDTMFDRRFFYDSHPPEQALALLEAAGFASVLSDYLNLPTSGRDKGRYGVLMRRCSGDGAAGRERAGGSV